MGVCLYCELVVLRMLVMESVMGEICVVVFGLWYFFNLGLF